MKMSVVHGMRVTPPTQSPVERAVARILRSIAAELASVIPDDRREVLGFLKDYLASRVEAFDKFATKKVA